MQFVRYTQFTFVSIAVLRLLVTCCKFCNAAACLLISVVQQLARFMEASSPMQRCTCYTKCLCVSSAKQRLTR